MSQFIAPSYRGYFFQRLYFDHLAEKPTNTDLLLIASDEEGFSFEKKSESSIARFFQQIQGISYNLETNAQNLLNFSSAYYNRLTYIRTSPYLRFFFPKNSLSRELVAAVYVSFSVQQLLEHACKKKKSLGKDDCAENLSRLTDQFFQLSWRFLKIGADVREMSPLQFATYHKIQEFAFHALEQGANIYDIEKEEAATLLTIACNEKKYPLALEILSQRIPLIPEFYGNFYQNFFDNYLSENRDLSLFSLGFREQEGFYLGKNLAVSEKVFQDFLGRTEVFSKHIGQLDAISLVSDAGFPNELYAASRVLLALRTILQNQLNPFPNSLALQQRLFQLAWHFFEKTAAIYRKSPLQLQITTDLIPLAFYAIEKGENPKKAGYMAPILLQAACKANMCSVALIMVKEGTHLASNKNFYGNLLIEAVKKGEIHIAELLIENGANVILTDTDGRTALHLACEKKSTFVASALLEKGAKVTIKDRLGNTPLHYAVQNLSIGLTHLLLEQGADMTQVNEKGIPAFLMPLFEPPSLPNNENPYVLYFYQEDAKGFFHEFFHNFDLARTWFAKTWFAKKGVLEFLQHVNDHPKELLYSKNNAKNAAVLEIPIFFQNEAIAKKIMTIMTKEELSSAIDCFEKKYPQISIKSLKYFAIVPKKKDNYLEVTQDVSSHSSRAK